MVPHRMEQAGGAGRNSRLQGLCVGGTTKIRRYAWGSGAARFFISVAMITYLCLQASPLPAETDAPNAVTQAHGLMWNRTGLPAVFPLQVKTPSGQNYYLTLLDAETGAAALAAFIQGGTFFKVLVPPGTYDLRLVRGETWQGEEKLFGPGKQSTVITLADPLTFAVRDFSTKAGHLIDVSTAGPDQMARISVKPQFICQTVRLKDFPRLRPSSDDILAHELRFPENDDLVRLPRFAKEGFRATGKDAVFPDRQAPHFSFPEYEVEGSLC